MPQHFEVIGDEYDDEIEGSVLGSVMGEGWSDYDIEGEDYDEDVEGYAGPMGDYETSAVVGYDEFGEPIVVGRRRGRRRGRRPGRRRGRRRGIVVAKPRWRSAQLAPGVIAPDQGLLPLPLDGVGGSQFTAAIPQITFQGQIQKPFRGERLLVSTVRTGATAVGRLISQFFVGTDLQQLDVPGFDAEQVGSPAAFGVRLTMKPAQPGVFIRLIATATPAPGGVDTIDAYVTLLGRLVH